MVKRCAVCEREFEVLRGTRKTCSDKCRQRLYRSPKTPSAAVALASPPVDGLMVESTRSALEAVGRFGTELGTAALYLAARLDNVGRVETGAGVAALMREYRATLAEAVKDADAADDPLEEIRKGAALKLIRTA